MAAQSSQSKTKQMLLGLCVMGGLTIFVCCGCFSSINNYLDEQAKFAKTPEGKAEAARKKEQAKISDAKLEIWLDVEKRIKDQLRNPRSVDFGWQTYSQNVSDPNEDGLYFVQGWFDAENGFGGTVRSEFAGFYSVSDDGRISRVPDKWVIESR